MLRIADLEFDVESCQIKAYCFDEVMNWEIVSHFAAHPEGKFHGHQPKLTLTLAETPPKAFDVWTKLAPREVRWDEKNDDDEVPSGMLYIFEHTLLYECHALLKNKRGKMYITVDGKCDVHYDDQYYDNLDFHLESAVDFWGVFFGRQTEARCRKSIARFLNPDDFDFSKTVDGVSILSPKPPKPRRKTSALKK
jgi:hypothetical protein